MNFSRLTAFLFTEESQEWLSILRVGLGAEIVFYCLSLRYDWQYLLGSTGAGLVSRGLSETIVDLDARGVPRLGWFVELAKSIGVDERLALNIAWWVLLLAGVLLLFGLFSRAAAIACWAVHLAAVKSSVLLSYGADNFTTIALFYLMFCPLPDAASLDVRWRGRRVNDDRQLSGFFRRIVQVHLCFIYFFSGVTKALGVGWWNGDSLWRALTRPPFNLISPAILGSAWPVLIIGGAVVVLLEVGYPAMVWFRRTRRIWLLAILAMHLGIGLAMGMYLFALIMIVLNLAAFGPGILWPENRADPADVAAA